MSLFFDTGKILLVAVVTFLASTTTIVEAARRNSRKQHIVEVKKLQEYGLALLPVKTVNFVGKRVHRVDSNLDSSPINVKYSIARMKRTVKNDEDRRKQSRQSSNMVIQEWQRGARERRSSIRWPTIGKSKHHSAKRRNRNKNRDVNRKKHISKKRRKHHKKHSHQKNTISKRPKIVVHDNQQQPIKSHSKVANGSRRTFPGFYGFPSFESEEPEDTPLVPTVEDGSLQTFQSPTTNNQPIMQRFPPTKNINGGDVVPNDDLQEDEDLKSFIEENQNKRLGESNQEAVADQDGAAGDLTNVGEDVKAMNTLSEGASTEGGIGVPNGGEASKLVDQPGHAKHDIEQEDEEGRHIGGEEADDVTQREIKSLQLADSGLESELSLPNEFIKASQGLELSHKDLSLANKNLNSIKGLYGLTKSFKGKYDGNQQKASDDENIQDSHLKSTTDHLDGGDLETTSASTHEAIYPSSTVTQHASDHPDQPKRVFGLTEPATSDHSVTTTKAFKTKGGKGNDGGETRANSHHGNDEDPYASIPSTVADAFGRSDALDGKTSNETAAGTEEETFPDTAAETSSSSGEEGEESDTKEVVGDVVKSVFQELIKYKKVLANAVSSKNLTAAAAKRRNKTEYEYEVDGSDDKEHPAKNAKLNLSGSGEEKGDERKLISQSTADEIVQRASVAEAKRLMEIIERHRDADKLLKRKVELMNVLKEMSDKKVSEIESHFSQYKAKLQNVMIEVNDHGSSSAKEENRDDGKISAHAHSDGGRKSETGGKSEEKTKKKVDPFSTIGDEKFVASALKRHQGH